MRFYLGTHQESWLGRADTQDYDLWPLFVSRRRLETRKTLPRALGQWALDSGGFTELSMFGTWRLDAKAYCDQVRRYTAEIGNLDWAAPQDWMCEPHMLAKTGLTVEQHQINTVANFLDLTSLWPNGPFIPVLQGWTLDDYLRMIDMYSWHGIELWDQTTYPLVGIGSVCRRQGTAEIANIVARLHSEGISLHGFGVKTLGLQRIEHLLTSADSMAWSFSGRRSPPLPGCTKHINCANCMKFAAKWKSKLQQAMAARGTADMVRRGRAAGVRTYVVEATP